MQYDSRFDEACANCRFFQPYIYEMDGNQTETNYGECRRFPPKGAVRTSDMAPLAEFPVVNDDLWCGEFDI